MEKKEMDSITCFSEKLGEVFLDCFEEDDNNSYDIAKGIRSVLQDCKSKREFEIADQMLIAICGYSLQSLLDLIRERDDQGYVWVSC